MAKYHLLIIDELGFVPLSKTGAELLFEVFSQRYERGSILVTSNLPFDEWTEIFGSERLTGCQRRSKSTPLAGVKMHHLMRFSPDSRWGFPSGPISDSMW